MVSKLQYSKDFARRGDPQTVQESDLTNATLAEGEAITVFAKRVPADKIYAWGFGTRNREDSRSQFMKAALKATGNGAGNDGDDVTGDLEVAIVDSEQRDVLFRHNHGAISNLNEAASDNRTERPMQPAKGPGARRDRHIEIHLVADSNSDGVEVANDGDMQLWYTEVDA